jgi:hypothetical protein
MDVQEFQNSPMLFMDTLATNSFWDKNIKTFDQGSIQQIVAG